MSQKFLRRCQYKRNLLLGFESVHSKRERAATKKLLPMQPSRNFRIKHILKHISQRLYFYDRFGWRQFLWRINTNLNSRSFLSLRKVLKFVTVFQKVAIKIGCDFINEFDPSFFHTNRPGGIRWRPNLCPIEADVSKIFRRPIHSESSSKMAKINKLYH